MCGRESFSYFSFHIEPVCPTLVHGGVYSFYLGRPCGPALLVCFFVVVWGGSLGRLCCLCLFCFCLDVDRNGKHPASSCTAFIGSIGTSLQSPTRPMIVRDFWRCPSTSLDLIQCQPMANIPGRNVQLLRLTERSSGQGERKMMEAPTK